MNRAKFTQLNNGINAPTERLRRRGRQRDRVTSAKSVLEPLAARFPPASIGMSF